MGHPFCIIQLNLSWTFDHQIAFKILLRIDPNCIDKSHSELLGYLEARIYYGVGRILDGVTKFNLKHSML